MPAEHRRDEAMGAVLANLLPLILGAAMVPMWFTLAVLLVRTEGGIAKASAFSAGAMAIRVLQGIIFGIIIGTASAAAGPGRNDLISSTLLLLSGILMWITAAAWWFARRDPEGPPPGWTTIIGVVSPLKAFGAGALLMATAMKQWAFTLSAIAVIEEASLGPAGSVVAYLVFVLAAQALVLAPPVLVRAAPSRAAALLHAERRWLKRHNRTLIVVLSVVLGTWFIAKGVYGLLDTDPTTPVAAAATDDPAEPHPRP